MRQSIEAFTSALQAAATGSIDEFLTYHPNHRDIARLAITRCLLSLEAKAVVEANYEAGFFPTLANGFPHPATGVWPDEISLITFNYDRVAKYVVSSILGARHGQAHAEAVCCAFEQAAVHVYGSFAMGYVFDAQKLRFVPQNRWHGGPSDIAVAEYNESAKGISVIGDDRSSVSPQIGERIRTADRIVFLGFGFDDTNVRVLGLEGGAASLKSGCQVLATGYRLSRRKREQVSGLFPGIYLGGDSTSCAAFVEESGAI